MKRWDIFVVLGLLCAFLCYRHSRSNAQSPMPAPPACRASADAVPLNRGSAILNGGQNRGPVTEPTARSYPLWDGRETPDDYARRVGLPRTLSVDLGDGVSMELVLIPAATFEMGVDPPAEPAVPRDRAIESESIIGVGASLIISLLIIPLGRAWRLRQRPSFSLRWLLVLVLGMSLISWGSARLLQDPWAEFHERKARYDALTYWEKPAHSETIAQPFYLSKFKVTQLQAKQIWAFPSRFAGNFNPAETTEFADAVKFCDLLNANLGPGLGAFRIPTETEWEFVCRAGTRNDSAEGSESGLAASAWYAGNSDGATHPVGLKAPNPFGIYDIQGNLQEWCLASSSGRPVIRGSSWRSNPEDCRATRKEWEDSSKSICVGLRLALPIPVPVGKRANVVDE